ncbi:MAG: cohesin domain-containing protein [Candidatus Neomarinimicrobiota bacterium]|nr:cohesin domain-containing protein [Candidatus Neomarinimicrobiota bacterium]
MKKFCRHSFFMLWLFIWSCTIHKKELDNPVDHEADYAAPPPSLVFYPKTQEKTMNDSVKVESFIVFKSDSTAPFSGVQVVINYNAEVLELDTLKPGLFITDTSKTNPLFVYNNETSGNIELFAYFLDTVKLDIEGTGHLADIIFQPLATGTALVEYELENCQVIDHNDHVIELNGERTAEVIIQ